MIVECPSCRARYDVSGRPAGTTVRCRCRAAFCLPDPPPTAGGLTCPGCGARVPANDHACAYCHAPLLVKACPRCFTRIFHGARHCHACGADTTAPAAATGPSGEAVPRRCPRCGPAQPLEVHVVGEQSLDECPGCHGVWVDTTALEKLVTERALGFDPEFATGVTLQTASGKGDPVFYVRCPDCDRTMNRQNFGRRSGVIVDVCRLHGTWFDASELPRVIDFVQRGGLASSHRREVEKLEGERSLQRLSAEFAAQRMRVGAEEEFDSSSVILSLIKRLGKFV